MDCSLPGSSVRGILQARVLEWVAVSFSRRSSQPRDRTRVSRIAGRRLMVLAGNFALEGFDFKRWVHWLGSPQKEQEALQFSSVQSLSCVRLCDPMGCSKPGFPVHHQFPELAQTHVCCVGNGIQPSHPLLFPSPPAFYLSQHQGLFQ